MIATSADALFEGKDAIVKDIYTKLLSAVKKFGPVKVESHKTSIHLVRTTAFAGVATRKSHLVLTIKGDGPLANNRVSKSEQTSRNRFHHEVKLTSTRDVDKELLGWLKAGWELSA